MIIGSDLIKEHPSKHGVLPFMFKGNGVVCVLIALYDMTYYDASWMNCHLFGSHPFVPDVDFSLEEQACSSEQEAIEFIRNWWANAKCEDYEYFRNGE